MMKPMKTNSAAANNHAERRRDLGERLMVVQPSALSLQLWMARSDFPFEQEATEGTEVSPKPSVSSVTSRSKCDASATRIMTLTADVRPLTATIAAPLPLPR